MSNADAFSAVFAGTDGVFAALDGLVGIEKADDFRATIVGEFLVNL
jgi:hypothetical protein